MPLIQRNCIGCGQVDDHPRHVTDEGDWHHDCHARSAFACHYCAEVVEHSGGKTGEDLRAHIGEHDPVKNVVDREREAFERAEAELLPGYIAELEAHLEAAKAKLADLTARGLAGAEPAPPQQARPQVPAVTSVPQNDAKED